MNYYMKIDMERKVVKLEKPPFQDKIKKISKDMDKEVSRYIKGQ